MADSAKSLTSKNPIRAVFDFRREEVPVILSLSTFFFLFILVFQLVRPLKKGLFVDTFGADLELYAKLLNIVISAIAVVVFTYLVNKLQRQRVIYLLCLFFGVAFVVLAGSLRHPQPWSIWSFYLLGDLVSTMMVAAFWAYVTDISTAEQAKRLYGVVGVGGVIGGWAGAAVSKLLLDSLKMTGLLLVAAGIMIFVIGLVYYLDLTVRKSSLFGKDDRPLEKKKESGSEMSVALEGARLALRSSYLAAIVGLMALYEIGSQVNDYQFSKFAESLQGVASTQAFMANVAFYANMLAVVVQLFGVTIIMKRFGLTAALLVLPLALLLSSFSFLIFPGLVMASLLFISDNGLNYSIQQTSRESLYVVTTPDEKYKARAFTNMFVQRVAKGLAIFAVMGLGLFGLKGHSVRYLSIVTMADMAAMVVLSIYAGRRFARKARESAGGNEREKEYRPAV